jgi:hypothetical protein
LSCNINIPAINGIENIIASHNSILDIDDEIYALVVAEFNMAAGIAKPIAFPV